MIREFSIKNVDLTFWNGRDTNKNRKVDFYDPCGCGCDTKYDPDLLGYLSGSNDDGYGFTLHIYDQDTYDKMRKIIPLTEVTYRLGHFKL